MSSLGRASAILGAGTLVSRLTGVVRSDRSRYGARFGEQRRGGCLHDREPAPEQHLRDRLDGHPHGVYRPADRARRETRRRWGGVRLQTVDTGHGRPRRRHGSRDTCGANSRAALSRFTDEQFALAIALAYWCIPQLFFYGLYALVGETLNARRVFGPYTWAPIVNNVVSIAGFLVFIALFGRGAQRRPDVDARHDHGAGRHGDARYRVTSGGASGCFGAARACASPRLRLARHGLRSIGTLAWWTFLW